MMIKESVTGNEVEDSEKIAEAFRSHVDLAIRQAIHSCWLCLPKKRHTHKELKKQIQRIVDRALKDFREDQEAFGR